MDNRQENGPCHTIWYIFKQLKGVFTSTNSINNGPVLLLKTTLQHCNCFLSSVAMDGKDGNGSKLEKNWANFFKF